MGYDTYRVAFRHARNRTRFEIEVKAENMEDASLAGEAILAEKIGAVAGQPTGWAHEQTEAVSEQEPARATSENGP